MLQPLSKETPFRRNPAFPGAGLLATAGRVQAMVVKCGSSTRGLWDGPVICNEIRLVVGQSNLAKGAKQKCIRYFTYVHYSHYLLKK